MSVLSAQSVRKLCVEGWVDKQGVRRYMIQPFFERTGHDGKTFGLSAAGYDVRVDREIWLWPFWGRLSNTTERFDIPHNVTFMVMDKSSWARKFVSHMNTNGEPGWYGWLTLEVLRFLPWPIRIRMGAPIVHIMFFWLDEDTEQPYGEGDKYQGQAREPIPYIHETDQCPTKPKTTFSATVGPFELSREGVLFILKSQIPSAVKRWYAWLTTKRGG